MVGPWVTSRFFIQFSHTNANNSLVRTVIYPCFPTNRPQPIFPHKNPTSMSSSIFFAKTSKMQEPQIHPATSRNNLLNTQKPTPSIHQRISELQNLKSSAFRFSSFNFQAFPGQKTGNISVRFFFSFVPSPGTEELQALAESTEKVTAEFECQSRDGGSGSKTGMARSYLGTFWSRPDGG